MARLRRTIPIDLFLTLPALSVYMILRIIYGRLDLWLSPGSSLTIFDRFFYGFSFVIPATLVFLYILPPMVNLNTGNSRCDPIIAPHSFQKITLRTVMEGFATGIIFFSMIYLTATISGVNVGDSPSDPVRLFPAILATSFITPILEEFFYRSIFIGYFLSHGGSKFASVVVSSLAFGAAHNPVAVPLLFLFGASLGILTIRNGIASSIVAHSVYNGLILLYS